MRARALVACAAVLSAGSPIAALANCAAPITYHPWVDGNTVGVAGAITRSCPDPDGMLRQAVDSGETVRLADFCGAAPGHNPLLPLQHDGVPYLDECVAPGAYRYGFARPYECAGTSCGTYRFATVEVTAPLDAACQRSSGNAAPTPVAPAAWSAGNALICDYDRKDDSLGCGTVRTGVGAVAIVDALALGLGLALLRRRRVRRA
jgi:hypothetical protein